ncbi:hypothetical protein EDD11_006599, partial [Mortierella claussenii]
YKEFDPYFTAVENAARDGQPTDTEEFEILKKECTEIMKAKTRQYAKRQVLWIRNKLLPLCREKDVKVFLLDATYFFTGKTLPDPESLNSFAKEMLTVQRDLNVVAALESWEKKECDICTEMQRIMHDKYTRNSSQDLPPRVIIHGPTSWEQHLKSKQHRRMKSNKAEMERDGANWWYFKAQEYKKRKREGTLSHPVQAVAIEGEQGSLGGSTTPSNSNTDSDSRNPAKVRRTDTTNSHVKE